MKKSYKILTIVLVVSILSLTVAGCFRKGPAQRAGESIDKADRSIEKSLK